MTGPHGLVTADVGRAAGRLLAGGLVAIPTETVYGLGADADDADAVARIFAVKGRPADHPLIVHLAPGRIHEWAATVPPGAAVLAEACWPGPLTLLLPRAARVIDAVTGGRDTVGLRVPAHPMTLDLLTRTGRGIAAPSANRFGLVSPTTAQHVVDDLGPYLDAARDVVLDGGACPLGVESTIIDATTDPPQLLRAGGIAREDVERLLDVAVADAAGPSRAAGMTASHYAPRALVVLVPDRRTADERAATLDRDGHHVAIIDHGDDLVSYARQLYGELRAADAAGADRIVAVLPPPIGLGHALRDRLTKAAAPA
ncbi:MAG: L-threonylcarbamoyladenylate synthase [Ilumatobacteraceae bacterium]